MTWILNKYAPAFKRDNDIETSLSVKQKTPRPSALVFSVSRMTSFLVIIHYPTLQVPLAVLLPTCQKC